MVIKMENFVKKLKDFKLTKRYAAILAAACAFVLLLGAVLGTVYLGKRNSPDNRMRVVERNTVNCTVFYKNSEFFDAGGYSPNGMNFLLEYTDYFRVTNSYSATLSRQIALSYSYKATQTLVVRARTTGNPLVFERQVGLADITREAETDRLSFGTNGNGSGNPGGAYTIDLRAFQDDYLAFIAEYQDIIKETEVKSGQALTFSAEVRMDFSYSLKDGNGLNRTITRGVIIPITTNPYTITFTGSASAEYDIVLRTVRLPSFTVILLITLVLVLAALGLIYSAKVYFDDGDAFKKAVKAILRKYSDDIAVISAPISLEGYEPVAVGKFKDLLKISVIQSRSISCLADEERGEALFFVVSGSLVYEYRVERAEERDGRTEDRG
jgi:hypothetical protein